MRKLGFSFISLLLMRDAFAGGGAASSDSDLALIMVLLVLTISLPIVIPVLRKKFKKRISG